MIVKHTKQPTEPVYHPIVVEIVLETEGEAIGFCHLLGCSETRRTCSNSGDVKPVKAKLQEELLPHLPAYKGEKI